MWSFNDFKKPFPLNDGMVRNRGHDIFNVKATVFWDQKAIRGEQRGYSLGFIWNIFDKQDGPADTLGDNYLSNYDDDGNKVL